MEVDSALSDRQVEQLVDELNLAPNICPAHPPNLPLPHHVDRFITLDRLPRRLKLSKSLLSVHAPFDRSVILLNGLITNDKFCMARIGRQKLRYLRRPRSSTTCHATDCREYLRDERQHRGGAHETTVASPSSASVDGGCGAALGPDLPTSPGMDLTERAGFRSGAPASLCIENGGEV